MEYILPIVTGFGGAFLGFLVAYTNEKAKNRAMSEDIAKITKEKEAVVLDFNLQQDRRKHQYERKHEIYAKYNNLLDHFDSEKNPFLDKAKLDTLLSTMLETMKSNPGNEGIHMKAINIFSNEINKLIREACSEIQQIAKQTNELKLVAPQEICSIVQEIDKNYSQIERISSSVFKEPIKLLSNQEDFSSVNQKIKWIHDDTKAKKLKLIELMRTDLENI